MIKQTHTLGWKARYASGSLLSAYKLNYLPPFLRQKEHFAMYSLWVRKRTENVDVIVLAGPMDDAQCSVSACFWFLSNTDTREQTHPAPSYLRRWSLYLHRQLIPHSDNWYVGHADGGQAKICSPTPSWSHVLHWGMSQSRTGYLCPQDNPSNTSRQRCSSLP